VNAKAQELTAHEIIEDLGSIIPDYFVCGVGTGGTIAGAGRVLKAAYPDIIIVAVQPAKSRALSGGEHHVHGIQGIGAGFIPEVYDPSIVDMIVDVEDEEAIKQARYLAKREGILAGMSSGAAAAACLGLPEGCAAVTIFPDTAERYISTDLYEVR